MIAILVKAAIGLGIPQRFAKAAAWVALIAGIVALLSIGKCVYDDRLIEQHAAQEKARQLESAREADQKIADQKAADDAAAAQTRKELTDAIKDLPDETPSSRRVALGCERLRRQGTDISRIPACSRAAPGS